MKVLISSCLIGCKVRWNNQDKKNQRLIDWVNKNEIELIPICPEDELLGTPRDRIRLIQVEEKICAQYKGDDIAESLRSKCDEMIKRYPDAVGFIGIHGSPTCGIGVGVKNLGKVIKGFMHQQSDFPTTQSNHLKNCNNRKIFLRRINEEQKRIQKND